MTNEIKAVLFDYGNVLCLPQESSILESMAACLKADLQLVTDAYWLFRDDFDRGVKGTVYWNQIADKCGVTVTDEQLLRLIELDNIGWTRANPVMAEWAQLLRSSGIATAIVSNMPLDIRQYLPTLEWLPEFDHYSFSCDLESIKPDPKIYEHTLKSLGVPAANALFLDDREVNVIAARNLGIESFVFIDAESLHEYVINRGLPGIRLQTAIA